MSIKNKKAYWLLKTFFTHLVLNRVIIFVPSWFIRKSYMKFLGMEIGNHSRIDMGVYIKDIRKNLKIGNHCHINQNSIFLCNGGIEIGDNVSISYRVGLFSEGHDIQSSDFAHISGKIKIEDYVWIGANATILSGKNGITIGKGAVVCAGAVVTKNIKPFSVVAGVPAKTIEKRNENLEYYPLKNVFWRFM